MVFARRVFLVSGIYGLLVVGPLYVLEARIGEQQPPPITHPEYFYGFVGVTLVFQLLFLVISRDPVRYRPIMLIGVLEKASYFIAIPILYAAGRVPFIVLVGSLFDFMWGCLFAISYAKTRSGS
jgi:hypothetical protein